MEFFGYDLNVLNELLAVPILAAGALLALTDKLIWHTRLEKAEDRAERWERIALIALSAGAEAGVKAAEVTVDVVSAIPNPAKKDRD